MAERSRQKNGGPSSASSSAASSSSSSAAASLPLAVAVEDAQSSRRTCLAIKDQGVRVELRPPPPARDSAPAVASSALEQPQHQLLVNESELYFLVAHFLQQASCGEALAALERDMQRRGLLPTLTTWSGQVRPQTFGQLAASHAHLPGNYLQVLLTRLLELGGTYIAGVPPGLRSVLDPPQRLLRDAVQRPKPATSPLFLQLRNRESGRAFKAPAKSIAHYQKMTTVLGHIQEVYVIALDPTRTRVVTGSDDKLVKVWDARTGLLLHTLRGHENYISEVAVSPDSRLVAAGSWDKNIRVWTLDRAEPVAVLRGHTNKVVTIMFSPSPDPSRAYLLSVGSDRTLRLWKYDPQTLQFDAEAIVIESTLRKKDEFRDITFDRGGSRILTVASDGIARLFLVPPVPPNAMPCPPTGLELPPHNGIAHFAQFSTCSDRFATGCHDGTLRIWTPTPGNPTNIPYIVLDIKAHVSRVRTPPGPAPAQAATLFVPLVEQPDPEPEGEANNDAAPAAVPAAQGLAEPAPEDNMWTSTACAWSVSDHRILVAVADNNIQVWDTNSGELVHILRGHTQNIFALQPHPLDERCAFSAGRDGKIILWDIDAGEAMQVIHDDPRNCYTEGCFSRTGDLIAASTQAGAFSIFALGENENNYAYSRNLMHQFRWNDYGPLVYDDNRNVTDSDSQRPPHLIPRGPLFSADAIYPQDMQPPASVFNDTVAFGRGIYEADLQRRRALRCLELSLTTVTRPEEADMVPMSYSSRLNKGRKPKRSRSNSVPDGTTTTGAAEEEAAALAAFGSDSDDEDFMLSDSEHGSEKRKSIRRSTRSSGRRSQRTSRRLRKRKRVSENGDQDGDDDEEEEEEDGYDSGSTDELIASDRGSDDSGSDAEGSWSAPSDDDEPPKRKQKGSSSPEKKKRKLVKASDQVVPWGPPASWHDRDRPVLTPYLPQIGDSVVYMFAGHHKFIETVRSLSAAGSDGLFENLPWDLFLERPLAPVEFCTVYEMEFIPGRPSYCHLTLTRESDSGVFFTVNYYDADGVSDFLILKSLFVAKMRREWAVGDHVLTLIDNTMYNGTIQEFKDDHRMDPWESVLVGWDTNEPANWLSPWELYDPEQSAPEVPEERLSPSEQENLLRAVGHIMKMGWSEIFHYQVDPDFYMDYMHAVGYRICLEMINQRLLNNYYRRPEAVMWDIRLVLSNAVAFNEPSSNVVRDAGKIVALFETHYARLVPSFTVTEQEQEHEHDSHTRSGGSSNKARPSLRIKPPPPKYKGKGKARMVEVEEQDETEREEEEPEPPRRSVRKVQQVYESPKRAARIKAPSTYAEKSDDDEEEEEEETQPPPRSTRQLFKAQPQRHSLRQVEEEEEEQPQPTAHEANNHQRRLRKR